MRLWGSKVPALLKLVAGPKGICSNRHIRVEHIVQSESIRTLICISLFGSVNQKIGFEMKKWL